MHRQVQGLRPRDRHARGTEGARGGGGLSPFDACSTAPLNLIHSAHHLTGSERPRRHLRLRYMGDDELYDEATEVRAQNGEVLLDGPDGVDVKVTPEAAEQTAGNLVVGAAKARNQRRQKHLPQQR